MSYLLNVTTASGNLDIPILAAEIEHSIFFGDDKFDGTTDFKIKAGANINFSKDGEGNALISAIGDVTVAQVDEKLKSYIPWTQRGIAGGVATLDESGKVPEGQLPSYVDDVLEFAEQDLFPKPGESGKIYVALDTNLTYRWSGSAYVEISKSLALGETASTAYPGNKGKQNADDIAAVKTTADNAMPKSGGTFTGRVNFTSDSLPQDSSANYFMVVDDYNTGYSTPETVKERLGINVIQDTISKMVDTKNTAGSTNSTAKLFIIGAASQAANPVTNSNSSVYMQNGEFHAGKVFNAVFNDYAEYRLCAANIDAGLIVTEDQKACDYVVLCKTKKPRTKMFVVSDTYGSCMGESINSIPVALVGRVLVYIEDGVKVKVGDYIGCGKNGKGRRMSRIEAFLYPNRVLGTVSSIPKYEEWGSNNVKINGRVWVNLK